MGSEQLLYGTRNFIIAPFQLLPFLKEGVFALAKTEGLKLAESLFRDQSSIALNFGSMQFRLEVGRLRAAVEKNGPIKSI